MSVKFNSSRRYAKSVTDRFHCCVRGTVELSESAPRTLQYMISCEAGANMIMTSDSNTYYVVTYSIIGRAGYYLPA